LTIAASQTNSNPPRQATRCRSRTCHQAQRPRKYSMSFPVKAAALPRHHIHAIFIDPAQTFC
jgi:hypothetical protein